MQNVIQRNEYLDKMTGKKGNGMIKVKARLERPEDLLPGMNVIVNL